MTSNYLTKHDSWVRFEKKKRWKWDRDRMSRAVDVERVMMRESSQEEDD
jgi:hypothetical protein